jgi:hypothetical protein
MATAKAAFIKLKHVSRDSTSSRISKSMKTPLRFLIVFAGALLVAGWTLNAPRTDPYERFYEVQIPNSRLVVIRSDAYHIAASNADECVTQTLAFLKEQKV